MNDKPIKNVTILLKYFILFTYSIHIKICGLEANKKPLRFIKKIEMQFALLS